MPLVELLWWDGCPSHPEALADLQAALGELGLDPQAVKVVEVANEQEAERHGFIGSPTIRVDGRDVLPPEQDQPAGLTCRVYRLRDGRYSPTPDPQDLRTALARAISERT
ncbi:MAG: hypothetical protein QOG62_1058 [Thermoleophilaceae bacterium]|jgi:hypothetical protein|nr:hypothetical protein [Thermoleophilaceae bacterium]